VSNDRLTWTVCFGLPLVWFAFLLVLAGCVDQRRAHAQNCGAYCVGLGLDVHQYVVGGGGQCMCIINVDSRPPGHKECK